MHTETRPSLTRWFKTMGYRQISPWYRTSKDTVDDFNTIGKNLKILKVIPNPLPFYDLIMGFYERPSNRCALRGPILSTAQKIIEVGVGTGYLLGRLIAATTPQQEITAVDLSQQMLDTAQAYLARKKLLSRRVLFRNGDCQDLPWPDNTFDLFVSSYLLDLLPENEIDRAIYQLERVLKPEGCAILITMTTELDGATRLAKPLMRLMNECYCLGYDRGRWNPLWKFLFAGYAPHCRPISLGKYLAKSSRLVLTYTKLSRVSFFPVRIYYVRKKSG
ncbi:class I SAM-dependent methyltransferase [Desulforhopalus singaporensis]|uniref:Methyltransferase domain-containing protein n=1 Tax=Desulforhopalus singaporensis TaxID=91360 RepID=A0A1H0N4D7_9BACT|nr:class I SAM-dependent methyltransferase [Desulforhopalus singaporensis]SDO87584.1 Methyltransferase domain-containing protein [Desulforhopalus singaporensis]